MQHVLLQYSRKLLELCTGVCVCVWWQNDVTRVFAVKLGFVAAENVRYCSLLSSSLFCFRRFFYNLQDLSANNIDNIRKHMQSYLGRLQKSSNITFTHQEVCAVQLSTSTVCPTDAHTCTQGSCWSLKVLEFFFQIFQAWKVLENRHGPWKSLNVCLESAWIWFSKIQWTNQLILKKVFQMASLWPQMCIKSIFGWGFAPDPSGWSYDAYICLQKCRFDVI